MGSELASISRLSLGLSLGLTLVPSPKPPGEPRFSLPIAQALAHAERLRWTIGITRIALLPELGGVQIAQASRPDNAWSSRDGSGKASSKEGAIIGSIMEEAERWAQEQLAPDDDQLSIGSFDELRTARGPRSVIDPTTLDLPSDTCYRTDLQIPWLPCVDLMTGHHILAPLDVLRIARSKHDICDTPRAAHKHVTTSGLGSGFSRAEAILHALCECIERHALRLAERSNTGRVGPPPYRFVDLSSASERIRALVARLAGHDAIVRVLDITSEIAIPTFHAAIVRDFHRADGHAAHPDPETAIELALLEAAQTIACAAADAREAPSIRAHHLHRHERPRPVVMRHGWFWLDPDPVCTPLHQIAGLSSRDIATEVRWCLDQLRAAGIEHVIALDLSPPAIAPAHVVRVIVPGLATNHRGALTISTSSTQLTGSGSSRDTAAENCHSDTDIPRRASRRPG